MGSFIPANKIVKYKKYMYSIFIKCMQTQEETTSGNGYKARTSARQGGQDYILTLNEHQGTQYQERKPCVPPTHNSTISLMLALALM